jgi:hypothetical protein
MKIPLIPQHKSKSEQKAGPLQTIQRKLAQNSLAEFKIGFEGDEFRSKRDVQSLINTIQDQYLHKLAMDKVSCLESIRIGWKLPRFALGPVLQQIVPMLLQQPAQVHHLQLVINSCIPLPTIQRLVSWHTLETLDLQSLRIRTRCVSDPRPVDRGLHDRGLHPLRRHRALASAMASSSYISSTTKRETSSDDGFITADDSSVLAALPYISPSIKTLKLVDCSLEVRDMQGLITCLRKKYHVQSLSLRHNRRLYLNGWEKDLLQSLPFLKALDLSICDLDPVDGMRLAAALTQSANCSGLESLSVAGNYRINEAIPQLVEACTRKGVIELDCSFCDVQNKCQHEVFNFLATAQPCSLRSLKMQAVRMKNVAALVRCIENNTSLERLILDHPREPYEVSSPSLDEILKAVRENYYLKVLRVDPPWDVDRKVLEEMEHWMTLNRCGRSILVHDSSKYWPRVLANTARLNDIDTLHWMLRNGAEQF